MSRASSNSKSSSPLGALDELTGRMVAEAQERAARLRKAAEQWHRGQQTRDKAAALAAEGVAQQDAAVALMVGELEPRQVGELLKIRTRDVTDAVRRYQASANETGASAAQQDRGTGGGSVVEPAAK